MQYYKYILRNVAKRHNRTVTFMPKPIFGDNGSGMHTHISLWKDEKPLFAGNGYAGLSDIALFFIGGILKHAPALTCLTNPTTNSYKRLVPGFEAPVNLAYSARNRSAAIRIPTYSPSPKAKRIEFRTPDAAANPYLAFSAMLLAGLDGIQNRMDPGDPLDKNLYEVAARRTRSSRQRARFAPRRNRSAPGRSLLPAARRRLQRKLHRQLDRHETKGIRRTASSPPPVRVRDVLRRVMVGRPAARRCRRLLRPLAVAKLELVTHVNACRIKRCAQWSFF